MTMEDTLTIIERTAFLNVTPALATERGPRPMIGSPALCRESFSNGRKMCARTMMTSLQAWFLLADAVSPDYPTRCAEPLVSSSSRDFWAWRRFSA